MSNSIWHKYNIKDIPNPHHEILAWTGTKHAVVIIKSAEWKSGDCDWIESWTYIQDIIAQADKAEVLQAKVDELEHIKNGWAKFAEQKDEQIQRLQKAVDLAVHSFNEICAGVPSDIWVFDEATKATNEIKQLIKEN